MYNVNLLTNWTRFNPPDDQHAGSKIMIQTAVTVLVAGFILNAADIAVTLLFAAAHWNAVLRGQGLMPSPWTPPYYIIVNFLGAALLFAAYQVLSTKLGPGAWTAVIASLSLWFTTRIYGGGHVVMRQMPLRLFAIMSSGLGLGYLLAGQFIVAWGV
jgi:hypothetical protein